MDKIESMNRGVYHSKDQKITVSKKDTTLPKKKNSGLSPRAFKENKTQTEIVFETIKSKKSNIKVAEIVEATGLKNKSVANILYKLKKLGAVSSGGKGNYQAITDSIPPGRIR